MRPANSVAIKATAVTVNQQKPEDEAAPVSTAWLPTQYGARREWSPAQVLLQGLRV